MGFPRYEKYKDSGVEWLGEVPEHWDVKKVKHIKATSPNALVDGPFGSNLKSEHFIESGDVYVIESNFATQGKLVQDELKTISVEHFSTIQRSETKSGDIIIAKIGAQFGKAEILPDIGKPAVISGNSMKLTVNKLLCSTLWAYWQLFNLKSSGEIDLLVNGSAQPALSLGIMNELIFLLPILEEQASITSFLDRETAKIDDLIAEQQKLIELLKEKRQAVISHAVTKGLNPDTKMKDSGIEWLGEVPEHWDVCHMKHLTTKITDGAHISPETENGRYEFISTKDIREDSIDFENCLLTSAESYEYLVRTGCRPITGDILFSKDGTIGKTVVVEEDRDFVVASSLIIIRPNQTFLLPDFFNYLCQANLVLGQVESFVCGAGLPRLSIQNLLKIIGVFPPLYEQKAIVEFLNSALQKLAALLKSAKNSITLLQERRTALISAAVTGKIDVRGFVPDSENGVAA